MFVLCARCGDRMTLHLVGQTRCLKCTQEVRAIEEADARRKVVRFPFAKDLRPFPGAA